MRSKKSISDEIDNLLKERESLTGSNRTKITRRIYRLQHIEEERERSNQYKAKNRPIKVSKPKSQMQSSRDFYRTIADRIQLLRDQKDGKISEPKWDFAADENTVYIKPKKQLRKCKICGKLKDTLYSTFSLLNDKIYFCKECGKKIKGDKFEV